MAESLLNSVREFSTSTEDGKFDLNGDELDMSLKKSSSQRSIHSSMSEPALQILNDLRRNNQLCDATISVGDATFNVHRAIMSASSPYFRVQFTSFNLPKEQKNSNGVHIPGMSGHIMEQVIQYAYVRTCNINEENVHEMLVSADYLGMLGLVSRCKRFLSSILKPENCVGIMGFAKFRFLDDLYVEARQYVLRYFVEVANKSKEILQISLDDFFDIISDDELNTREEDLVWKLCIKWVDTDPDNRKQHVAFLMTGVRLGLMTPKFFEEEVRQHAYVLDSKEAKPIVVKAINIIYDLQDIKNISMIDQCFMEEVKEHPYVLQSEKAKPHIVETFKFMYDLDIMGSNTTEKLTTPALAMPRLPHEVIFAIGGWSGGTSKGCIETYDTRADRWVNIQAEDPAGPRAYHGTAVIGHNIYSIGGYDGVEYFNTCRLFDAVEKTWKEIAPMHSRRCYVSVAELNGFIYAIGGYDGHNRLNTVERYSPTTNQWTLITSMNMQRSDASACTLNGKIYATGGFNGQECLDSAEFFDPATNVWTRIPNMNHRRSGVSCVAFRGQVYVVGGFNGTARLSTAERYDPETQSWTFIREMNNSRSNFGLEIIDDMIFAIGGFNGISTISHTECYVAETDEWMEATDMNVIRSALTANNVAGLPNKRDYIHKERNRLMEERRQRILANNLRESPAAPSNSSLDVDQPHDALDASLDVNSYVAASDSDEDNIEDGGQTVTSAPRPVAAPAPPPQQLAASADQIEHTREQNRRFRVQLRNQRYSSHPEIRRRS